MSRDRAAFINLEATGAGPGRVSQKVSVRRYGERGTFVWVAEDQGLALRTGFFHLDWTLRFTHPTVVIDDHPHECPWGENFIPLESGPHQIGIFYRYLGGHAGKVSFGIDVAPNEVVKASYRAPRSVAIAFLPGKLTVESSDTQV